MKKVFLVILSYKTHKDTFDLLESLKKVKKESFELSVVIVDNYPKDSIELNTQDFKELNLRVIYSKENLGFSGGNNIGINESLKNGADYVVILNNDTIVDPLFIEELVKAAESSEDVGIATPKIYFAKGYEFHKDRYEDKNLGKVIWYAGGKIDWKNALGAHRGVDEIDSGQYDKTSETELATGCCLLIKKDVLEKIGGYDKKYFLYFEDADLSHRTIGAGFKIRYAPKAIIWHKNAQSSGGSGSALQDYFTTRNRLIFGYTYAPMRTKIALFRQSLNLILKGRPWQRKGAIDFYLLKFGKGSYPVDK